MRLDLEATKSGAKDSAQGSAQEITRLTGEFQQFKTEVEHSHRMMQGSLSAAISTSAAAQSVGGGSGPKNRTLDEDKRLEGVGQISGHESLAAVTEWYSKVMIKMESACPGSTAILEWAIAQDEEITSEVIDSARTDDRFISHRLNRELISWMANVFTSKAWSYAKPAKHGNGLEAWRLVHRNITMQGPQQVQQEYSYLLKPAGPNKTGDIAQWISEWEDRASKLSLVSPVHSFPDELRRNIYYEAMPKDVREQVDAERRRSNLVTHMEMRKWLIALGTQASLAVSKGPPPLLLNNVSDEAAAAAPPPPAPYSYADWEEYAKSEEAAELLAALAKGKGDKGGKGAKGKGFQFQGQCFKCLKYGHRARDCTEEPAKGKGKYGGGKYGRDYGGGKYGGDKGGKSKGKGKLYWLEEDTDWTLCMTGSPMSDQQRHHLDKYDVQVRQTLNRIDQSSELSDLQTPKSQDLIGSFSQWHEHINQMVRSNGKGSGNVSYSMEKSAGEFSHPVKALKNNFHSGNHEKCIQDDWTFSFGKKAGSLKADHVPDISPKAANKFELLVIDDPPETSIEEYPPILQATTYQRPKPVRPKAQGRSKDDKELDKIVRDIQSNRVKVMISKKMKCNLDSLDDASPSESEPPDPILSVSPGVTRLNSEPSVKISPIDNALAVVKCLKEECSEVENASMNEILANLQLVHSEVEIADSAVGSCVPFSVNRTSFRGRDELAEAAAREIREQTGHSLNVLCDEPPELNALSTSGKFRWVQIATVLDSGAVRHVTPNGVFSLEVAESQRSKEGHNYYGPSGDAIRNLGTQVIKGASDGGQSLNIGFDVAKITRPLVSVSEMVCKDYKVVLDNEGSYIQNKKTGKHINVRQEGSLYYLDLWVQVPEALSNSPFVRQAS